MPDHLDEGRHDVVAFRFADTRPHADPERIVHKLVGVRQFANDAILDVAESGLARQVASEQQARADFMILEISGTTSRRLSGLPSRMVGRKPNQLGSEFPVAWGRMKCS